MTEFSKEEYKDHPTIGKLFEAVRKGHIQPGHVERTLMANRDTKDFCVLARHFMMIDMKLFLHYDTENWLEFPRVLTRIATIGVYDGFMEYETARMRALTGHKDAEGISKN